MKAFDLSGRVAVVTGGNGGIRTETKRKRVRLNGNGSGLVYWINDKTKRAPTGARSPV